jgi:hypothetical protein
MFLKVTRRKAVTAVLGAAAAVALMFGSPLSASATTYHYFSNHYSSDNPEGAELVGGSTNSYIEWNGDHYDSTLVLEDISPDGKGPIMFVTDFDGNGLDVGDHYYHNTDGSGYSILAQPYAHVRNIKTVFIQICNGGSQSAPQNCAASFPETNPEYQ